jgi:hypothetical protein
MAVRKLPTGKYEIRYPSHRNPKGRISYRFKVVGYSKRKAKESLSKNSILISKSAKSVALPTSQRNVKSMGCPIC